MVFNELSMKCQSLSNAKEQMSYLVKVYRIWKEKMPYDRFYYTDELFCEHFTENYAIYDWINDKNISREERNYFRGLLNKGLRVSDDELFDSDTQILYHDRMISSKAATLAYENDDAMLSLKSETIWGNAIIVGRYSTLYDDEKEVSIFNISDSSHIPVVLDGYKNRIKSNVSSGRDIWNNRKLLFPNLIFCDTVKDNLEDGAVTIRFQAVMDKLKVLDDYFSSFEGTFDPDALGHRARPESETVINSDIMRQQRIFITPYGKSMFFKWHISFPSDSTGRIYFEPDAEHKKGVIGYIGNHLKTKKY